MAQFFVVLLVVYRLTINLQESVEGDYLTIGDELLLTVVDGNIGCCLLYLRIGHLTGYGAFPDQVIEFLLLLGTLYLRIAHIGRTNGLMSLLRTLCIGMELPCLAVFLTPEIGNLFLTGAQTE